MKENRLDYNEADLRKQRRIWGAGVVSLVFLAAACIGWAVWRVPQDIGARTIEALRIAGIDPRVRVAVDGRNVTLSGEVHNTFDRARMSTITSSIRGVRGVADRLKVSPIEPARSLPAAPAPASPAPAGPAPGPKSAEGRAHPESAAAGPSLADAAPDRPAGPPAVAAPAAPSARTLDIPAARPLRFGFNSARLTAESESVLREIADALQRRPETRLLIAGHADGTGAKDYNQRLSARRAEAAARWLVSAGIDPARLQTRGYGETRPRADNLTRKGRALNRRVEFIREE